jgi:hypothetical protein
MSVEELEDLAFRGGPMPDLRSQAQVLLFQSFRDLYDFARRSGMSPEQGKREKAQILEAYRINKFLEELQESTQQMWSRIETAASEYRKAPSVELADKLLEAIYTVKRKENTNAEK